MSALNRRRFLQSSLAAGAAITISGTKSSGNVLGANDRIRVAVAGLHGRGRSHYGAFARMQGVEVAYVVDPDTRQFGRAVSDVEKTSGKKPKAVQDVREVLDDDSLNVVSIATPNHWHSLMSIWAVQAGKDVYVEKPLSHNIFEGRQLVEAARKYKRILQHGTQMRSSQVTAKAGEILASGLLGSIKMSKAWNCQKHTHRKPVPDSNAPSNVNYDMWLGPAPKRRFNPNRFHGYWNWYRDYGNGDIGGDGIHDIDIARWGLGVTTHPVRTTAHGSRIELEGEREFADNMMVAHHYAEGKVLLYEDRGWTPYGPHGFDSGNAFYGTEGMMVFSRRGYFQVYMGRNREKGPGMRGDTGHPKHFYDFLDCVRTRKQTIADAEVAHLSCALVHLGDIAYRTSRVLNFDPATETITGDKEANQLLTKEYRSPWGLPETV